MYHVHYLRQDWSRPHELLWEPDPDFVTHPTGEITLDLGVVDDLGAWQEGLAHGVYLVTPYRRQYIGDVFVSWGVPLPEQTFVLASVPDATPIVLPPADVACRIAGDVL